LRCRNDKKKSFIYIYISKIKKNGDSSELYFCILRLTYRYKYIDVI